MCSKEAPARWAIAGVGSGATILILRTCASSLEVWPAQLERTIPTTAREESRKIDFMGSTLVSELAGHPARGREIEHELLFFNLVDHCLHPSVREHSSSQIRLAGPRGHPLRTTLSPLEFGRKPSSQGGRAPPQGHARSGVPGDFRPPEGAILTQLTLRIRNPRSLTP
jgi:hypothetical protein